MIRSPTRERTSSTWRDSITVMVLAGLISAGPVSAQTLDISGYFENTLQIDYTAQTKEQLLNAAKLRLDFSSSVSNGLEFTGNINFIVNVGAIERDIRPYLPDAAALALESAGAATTYSLSGSRTFLDNAYLTWLAGPVRLRLGKQQLSWGPAYSYNPTDLFHRKNLLDPTYEKEGVTAIRTDYRWGVGGQLSVIAVPNEDFASSGYAARFATHIESIGYDIAVTAHRVQDSTAIDPTTLRSTMQRRSALGVELSGELLGLGAWLEGNYNWMQHDSDFTRFVLGIDYTLTDGTYLLAEALYSGRSQLDRPYALGDWLANLYFGEPIGTGWIMAGIRRDISELTLASVYLFATPDGSLLVNPRVDTSVAQNADLVLFGAFTLGREDGAFPSGLYSLLCRASVYF
ncbi:MAG: hypothetical protein AMS18_07230 [Gemmatimonas sp. SG8_17]|nr:MAG: hypothetical protein AMS18_07230 [Gemmatimonas sp. SG8_17]